jgi:hypothetical protein
MKEVIASFNHIFRMMRANWSEMNQEKGSPNQWPATSKFPTSRVTLFEVNDTGD